MIAKRIHEMMEAEHLKLDGLADVLKCSPNTLKGIFQRNSFPRGEIMERIAKEFPQYVYWLLTGNTDGENHISPETKKHLDAMNLLKSAGYEITRLPSAIV